CGSCETRQPLACLAGRHGLQQRRELRAVSAPRERRAQRHVERGAAPPRGRTHRSRDRRKVVAALGGGGGGGGEVAGAGAAHRLSESWRSAWSAVECPSRNR